MFSFSRLNACTTFKFPIISSINAVCSPRISDVFLKSEYVLDAMNLATKRDSGVITTTTSAIIQLITSIITSVPIIVRTPVNS